MSQLKTYDEWKALGFQVQRGQRSVARNKNGTALFSDRQVADDDPPDYDYEDLERYADATGYDPMDYGDRY